jgi:O-antigen/teichoic acid export membrane protein
MKTLNPRLILINNISTASRLIAFLAVSFVMTPFLVKTLGTTLYGLWAMVQSALGYFTLMNMGMPSAVMKFVAESSGKEDRLAISEVITAALVFYGIIVLIGGIILAGLLAWGIPLFHMKTNEADVVWIILLILGIDMLCTFAGSVFHGVLTGYQRFYAANSVDILCTLIGGVAVYIMLSHGYGIKAMALITLFMNVLKWLIIAGLVFFRYRFFSFAEISFNPGQFWRMVSFGTKSLFAIIAGRIHYGSDALIIGAFLTPAMVPFYLIPANLINYSRSFLLSITQSFLPLFSHLEAKGDNASMTTIYLQYTRLTLLVFLPLLVMLSFFGETFMGLWMGPEYARIGGPVILLLTISLAFSGIQPLSERLLTGTSRQGVLVWTGFAAAAVFLITGLLLVRQHGLTGLATAFLISSLGPSFFILKRSLSVMNIPIRTFLAKCLYPNLWPVLTAAAISAYIRLFHCPQGYGALLISMMCVGGFYILVGYFAALTAHERRLIRQELKSRSTSLKLFIKQLRGKAL